MIKNVLKNFFKNLIYIFVPMGIFYLCLLLILFSLAGAAIDAIKDTALELSSLFAQSVENSETLFADFFTYAFSRIDPKENFSDVLNEILTEDWIRQTVYGFVETLNVSVDVFRAGLDEIVERLAEKVVTATIVIAIALVLSLSFANFVTRFFLARKTAKKTLFQKCANLVLQVTLIAAAMKLASALITMHVSLPLLALLLYALLSAFFSLFSAWFVYRKKNLPFSAVVNWRNIKNHLLGSLLILALTTLAVALVALVNAVLALLVAVPLVVYCTNVIDVNADSYVKSLTLSPLLPTENIQSEKTV